MSKRQSLDTKGFTIPELIITLVVLSILITAVTTTYTSMISAANFAKLKSAGLGVATAQMEYLRSLPYDYLAVEGGTINSSGPKISPTKDASSGTFNFEITTEIQYADDAFDGCLNYPAAQSYLCRNGPPKVGLPVDTDARDYKIVDVIVRQKETNRVASHISTQISARVAETSGNSGALVVTVIDSTGQPIAGASVNVTNSTLSPNFNQTATTDTNGTALFLDVTPDSGKDFVITASKTGYSSLSTIGPSGSLIPTYPKVNVLAQKVTSATMKIDQVATDSLQINIVDSSGNPIPGAVFSIKGGTKLYTSPTDQSYGFVQSSVTSDGNGQYVFHGLTPGEYYLCFNNSQCNSGNYLTVLQTAYGSNTTQPVVVAPGNVSQSGSGPMQLAKLFVAGGSSPRINNIDPATFSASSGSIATSQFKITGANLAGANVTLQQGATTLNSSVVGLDTSSSITRQVDLSARTGAWKVVVSVGGYTLTQTSISPGTSGGINVEP